MDDEAELAERNERFIEAWRQGSWALLEPMLSRSFSYLDGRTGEVWDRDRYAADLSVSAQPELVIDQVAVHVDGDVASVSARSRPEAGRYNRYLDTYRRADDGWVCVHACVWPLAGDQREPDAP